MFPPIYSVCAASAGVVAVLGDPVRLDPFGEAQQGTGKPYAVWQQITGGPENYIGNAPDIDLFSLQIDCYAMTATDARGVAETLRDAIEPVAHITRWSGEAREPDTKLYRYSFDVDWWVHR